MNSYIFFVFGEHNDQSSFIKNIAEELSYISNSENVKYYYGETSGVFTFKSLETLNEVKEFLDIIFGDTNLIYFLLPYNDDKMSVKLPKGILEHLFDVNNSETMSGLETMAQNMTLDELPEIPKNLFQSMKDKYNDGDYDDDDDDDDELEKLKQKPIEPSVDDILDKISDKGIKSLTEQEKKILDKYSKTI